MTIFRSQIWILFALAMGLLCGYMDVPFSVEASTIISTLFVNILKLISLPLIFLSVVASISSLNSIAEFKKMGGRIITYAIGTTFVAGTVAMLVFKGFIMPTSYGKESVQAVTMPTTNVLKFLTVFFPDNLFKVFIDHNVVGVIMISLLFGLAILRLPEAQRLSLATLFQGLFQTVMKMIEIVLKALPIAVWSFAIIFYADIQKGFDLGVLGLYVAAIITANLVQAVIVLPVLLKVKKISPFHTFKGAFPALVMAFFTKSSGATLPMTIKCATENLGVSQKHAAFSLPLCATLNMNACAGFILITMLFIAQIQGMVFTPLEHLGLLFLAVVGALGNAAVPMGCYFVTISFLVLLNVPVHLMGIILPIYAFLDMLETSINVWSDLCITKVIEKE